METYQHVKRTKRSSLPVSTYVQNQRGLSSGPAEGLQGGPRRAGLRLKLSAPQLSSSSSQAPLMSSLLSLFATPSATIQTGLNLQTMSDLDPLSEEELSLSPEQPRLGTSAGSESTVSFDDRPFFRPRESLALDDENLHETWHGYADASADHASRDRGAKAGDRRRRRVSWNPFDADARNGRMHAIGSISSLSSGTDASEEDAGGLGEEGMRRVNTVVDDEDSEDGRNTD
ncbi:hypothetical protein BC830DRAFT_1157510 [Chytriomyces sp. MP71]|nr:hypothetical protein BC830DRAFT_1157510 [Chytriomyces sp. MP71]